MEKNRRLVYCTETPYTTAQWPVLSTTDEADIVALLCGLLEPVGNYRKEHIKPSRGKSSRKRKRRLTREAGSTVDATTAPPPPHIFSRFRLGFNTTIRHLESLSAISRPQPLDEASLERSKDAATQSVEEVAPLSAVFVCRTGLPPILTSSLPLLAVTASLAFPEAPPICLVPLGRVAADKLAQSLHQPRVGFIGLLSNTSTADNLINLVRTRVRPVDVPWLREASSGTYLPVKVRQIEVKLGPKKKRGTHPLDENGGAR